MHTQAAMQKTGWLSWLVEGQGSEDCQLQSYCTAALLHMQGAAAANSAVGIMELDLVCVGVYLVCWCMSCWCVSCVLVYVLLVYIVYTLQCISP